MRLSTHKHTYPPTYIRLGMSDIIPYNERAHRASDQKAAKISCLSG
jgi:hypothetical protein